MDLAHRVFINTKNTNIEGNEHKYLAKYSLNSLLLSWSSPFLISVDAISLKADKNLQNLAKSNVFTIFYGMNVGGGRSLFHSIQCSQPKPKGIWM